MQPMTPEELRAYLMDDSSLGRPDATVSERRSSLLAQLDVGVRRPRYDIAAQRGWRICESSKERDSANQ